MEKLGPDLCTETSFGLTEKTNLDVKIEEIVLNDQRNE